MCFQTPPPPLSPFSYPPPSPHPLSLSLFLAFPQQYLSQEHFEEIMGMTKDEFEQLGKMQQYIVKLEKGLG